METFFKISEIAKITGTSRKNLIYYDKIDLIKPTYKDEKTGYRYYSQYQFFEIRLVLMLREIGISIKDIKEYLQSNDIDKNINFMMKYEKEVDKRIERLVATKEVLNEAVERLYKYKNVKEHTPIIKHINHKHIIGMDVNFSGKGMEIMEKFKNLPKYAKSRGVNKLSNFGAVLPKDSIFQGHYHTNIKSIFGIIENPDEYDNGYIQNYGLCGCIYHKGEFLGHIEEALEKLIKYIYENGYEVVGDPISIHIIDESTFTSVKNGLIEILVPVDKVK